MTTGNALQPVPCYDKSTAVPIKIGSWNIGRGEPNKIETVSVQIASVVTKADIFFLQEVACVPKDRAKLLCALETVKEKTNYKYKVSEQGSRLWGNVKEYGVVFYNDTRVYLNDLLFCPNIRFCPRTFIAYFSFGSPFDIALSIVSIHGRSKGGCNPDFLLTLRMHQEGDINIFLGDFNVDGLKSTDKYKCIPKAFTNVLNNKQYDYFFCEKGKDNVHYI